MTYRGIAEARPPGCATGCPSVRGAAPPRRPAGICHQAADPHPDRELVLSNSNAYLEAFGHIIVAWMWLEQLVAAAPAEGSYYDGKRQAGRYFFRWELPKTDQQLSLLEAVDDTVNGMPEAWF
ncbi:acyl-CoA dehydrogenase C-terminal domain-containing protein [Amycolatopsis sp. H6(2020)]|nr:acyl-CoA dehydrogenase C-terminal domain-containing protein [Amycolatopsis sp. H6(2020)]